MSYSLTLPVLLALMLLLSTAGVADDVDQDEAASLRQQGVILPLADILAAVEKQQQGRVIEVELEQKRGRYIYEIEIVDDQGKVWEFKLDASDAQIISREKDD